MATILVVEDDAAIRAMERRILSGAGHVVIEARDGTEALEAARREPPDLVVLDVMMSGLSGFEVAAKLRADAATAEVPVLFVTSRAEPSAMDEGFKAGGTAYLTKPFSRGRLLSLVERLLGS